MANSYRVYTISDPRTDEVIWIGFESEKSYGYPGLYHLKASAKAGKRQHRFVIMRELLAAEMKPGHKVVASSLSKHDALALVRKLQVTYPIKDRHPNLGGRARVHRKHDPDSPFLDPSPNYYVYELVRPDKNEVFYIGKGSLRHEARINMHIRKAKKGQKTHKAIIIRKLLRQGLKPIERRVCIGIPEAEAYQLEAKLLEEYGIENLSNDAPGGQGPPTGDHHWTRKYPERVLRGENHPIHKHPELKAECARRFRDMPNSARRRGESHHKAALSDAQIIKLRDRFQREDITPSQLAREFDVSLTCVLNTLRGKMRGFPPLIGPERRTTAKLSFEQKEEIYKRLQDGECGTVLAGEFGVTSCTISKIRVCWVPRKGMDWSRRSGFKKLDLTFEQREEIHRRSNAGEKGVDLAKEFGVNVTAISKTKLYWIPGKGFDLSQPPPQGRRTVLIDDQREEIHRRTAIDGEAISHLAKEFNVCDRTISKIKYNWIPGKGFSSRKTK